MELMDILKSFISGGKKGGLLARQALDIVSEIRAFSIVFFYFKSSDCTLSNCSIRSNSFRYFKYLDVNREMMR